MFFTSFINGERIKCDTNQVLESSKSPERALIYKDNTVNVFYNEFGKKVTLIDGKKYELFVITQDGHAWDGVYTGYILDRDEFCIKVNDIILPLHTNIFLGIKSK